MTDCERQYSKHVNVSSLAAVVSTTRIRIIPGTHHGYKLPIPRVYITHTTGIYYPYHGYILPIPRVYITGYHGRSMTPAVDVKSTNFLDAIMPVLLDIPVDGTVLAPL